jgi:ABC-type lipoprotein release transport system permease subunit
MERCFIATKESNFIKDYEEYVKLAEKQRKFVKEFAKKHGIEGTKYYVSGNGFVNSPFEEHNKEEITLCIEPTKNDLKKFGKMLKKPNKHGLCGFKKGLK